MACSVSLTPAPAATVTATVVVVLAVVPQVLVTVSVYLVLAAAAESAVTGAKVVDSWVASGETPPFAASAVQREVKGPLGPVTVALSATVPPVHTQHRSTVTITVYIYLSAHMTGIQRPGTDCFPAGAGLNCCTH